MLGRNGSGKTSLLHSIIGFPAGSGGRIASGRVLWHGPESWERLDNLSTVARVRRGIMFVPAEDKVFRDMTVREHLVEALAAGRRRAGADGRIADVEAALELFPALRDRLDAAAGLLSGGERQQLALAAALARQARLLLVDEASLGLSPAAMRWR